MNTRRRIIRWITPGLLVLLGTPAIAAPTYVASASVVPSPGTPFFDGGTSSGITTSAAASVFSPVNFVSAPGIAITGDSTGEAHSLADRGTLQVSVRAAQGLQGGTLSYYTNDILAQARAQFMLDDVVITPINPANPEQFVLLILHFAMDGVMPDPDTQGSIFDTALRASSPTQTFGTVDNNLSLATLMRDANGTFVGQSGGSARIVGNATYAAGATAPGMGATGSFGGMDAALQSGAPFIADVVFVGVPVGRPLELTVDLRATAESLVGFPENGGVWQGSGRVDFGHTLTFATDAVATLPAGFTLNSASAGITNNVWTPVPLPGTLVLMTTGLLGVLIRMSKRRGRTAGN